MSSIGQMLSELRKDMKFNSTKELYSYLKNRGLDCNYQHFVKIEKNTTIPSSQIINQIAAALDKKNSKELVLTYCAQLFPKHDYLFDYSKSSYSGLSENSSNHSFNLATELNGSQISKLSLRKDNYYLFLVLTLSRIPIKISEFEKMKSLLQAIPDLVSAHIAIIEGDYIRSIASEYRFPKDASYKKIYDQFDVWDTEFTSDFKFESLVKKVMTRRISPRYLSAIQQQIESLVGLVRLSDESDKIHNTEVLHLNIQMQKGELPG